jgi:hypothetical protein
VTSSARAYLVRGFVHEFVQYEDLTVSNLIVKQILHDARKSQIIQNL